MIQVHFEGRTAAEVKEQMLDFLSLPTLLIPTEDKSEPAQDVAPAETAAPAYKLEDVRKACVAYKDKHGSAALKDVLAKFGAKGLPDVPAEKFAELMEAVA